MVRHISFVFVGLSVDLVFRYVATSLCCELLFGARASRGSWKECGYVFRLGVDIRGCWHLLWFSFCRSGLFWNKYGSGVFGIKWGCEVFWKSGSGFGLRLR